MYMYSSYFTIYCIALRLYTVCGPCTQMLLIDFFFDNMVVAVVVVVVVVVVVNGRTEY